jgi:hypothetical protein
LTAYSFDGNDDQVDLPNEKEYKFQSEEDFTLSAWIRAVDDGSYRYIVTYVDNGGSADVFDGWRFVVTNSNQLVWHISDDTSSQTRVDTSSDFIEPNRWHHVCVVHKSGGNTILYSDGESVDESQTASLNTIDYDGAGAGAFVSGRPDGNNLFNGSINDVRIYNRALSPQEIQALYEWGNGNYASPPNNRTDSSSAVSRWKFDGDVTDSWGNNGGTDNTSAGFSSDAIRGQAKNFDGDDDYVVVDPFPDLSGSPVTISAWVYLDGRNDYSNAVSTADQTGSSRQNALSIQHGSQTGDRILTYDSSGNAYTLGYSITQTDWYHIVAFHDSSNLRGYINGFEMANSPLSVGEPLGQSTAVLVKGANAQLSSTSFLPGKVDDVRVYDRALSHSEVFQLYQWGTRGRDMRKLTVNSR